MYLAEGSFSSVNGVTSETDATFGTNAFGLQLNSNNNLPTSLCQACTGWEQFVFANFPGGQYASGVYMQYWLINAASCPPPPWIYFAGGPGEASGCYFSSPMTPASTVPPLTIADLGNLSLMGTSADGTDTVALFGAPSGEAFAVGQDSILNLEQSWNAAEFNVFGAGGGSEAYFNSGSTIVVKTSVDADGGSTNAPSCEQKGFTAETDNLTLVPLCLPYGGGAPAIEFMESNAGFSTRPSLNTGSASSVTSSTAVLNGSVNPNASETLAWFQYNTNSSALNCTSPILTLQALDAGSGTTNVGFEATISGLSSSTPYYFVACALYPGGPVEAGVTSFTTLPSNQETVSPPSTPSGPTSGTPGTAYSYTTGGSSDNLGNPVQYLFYWGDGSNSGWLPTGTTSATHSWSAGSYNVTAQARSATNNSVVSSQSGALSVKITAQESVSTPSAPSGPASGTPATPYSYSTGGSSDNLGNPVQYLFYWGDGSNSGWLPTGTTSATHSWSAGSYNVTAQARSATNNAVVSSQSAALAVSITAQESVSTPSTPSGPTSGTPGTPYSYSTGGSSDNLGNPVQYLFYWGDGSNSGWLPTGSTSATHSWSAGTYGVTAQARSATNNSVVSSQSGALSVKITAQESVSTPSTPSGPATGTAGTPYSYSTGGSSDNLGNPVQYLFNWGDGSNSGWLPVGTASAMHSWAAGSYNVTAQARSATNNSVVSPQSGGLPVSIAAGGVLPDVVVTALTGPNVGNPGGAIEISSTVQNQGSASSGAFQLEFYFSPTSSPSLTTAVDTLWGCQIDSLAPGEPEGCAGPIGIPTSLTPGIWYLAALAEVNGQAINWRVADSGPVTLEALPTILGAGSDGNLYSIIPATGATTLIGPLPSAMSDIAAYNGSLYGVTLAASGAYSVLYTIDPGSGAGAPVGSGTGANLDALVFSASGTLYAAGGDSLYTVNTSTGYATLVGSGSGSGVYQSSGDLAFDSSGTLYLTSVGSSGDQLFSINPVTGQGTSIGGIGFSNVYGLVYYGATAYGFTAGGQVLAIDLATGVGDEIESYSPGFNGAAVLVPAGPIVPFDFNHTGHSDVIWEEPTIGWSQVWYLGGPQGATITGAATLTKANSWKIVGIGDFNGDGNPDVVWQDPVSGAAQVWFMGGPGGNVVMGAATITVANSWRIVSVADFNQDGNPDLLWQDPVSGYAQIWYMGGSQGTAIIGAATLTKSNSWHIVGSADFNGDGVPDVLWQDPASGTVQVWYMGGDTPGEQGSRVMSAADLTASSWHVVAIADFNRDGHPDVVFQSPASGAAQIFFYTGAQGTTFLSAAVLSDGNPWFIAGPH
jgi:hypothetical protein